MQCKKKLLEATEGPVLIPQTRALDQRPPLNTRYMGFANRLASAAPISLMQIAIRRHQDEN